MSSAGWGSVPSVAPWSARSGVQCSAGCSVGRLTTKEVLRPRILFIGFIGFPRIFIGFCFGFAFGFGFGFGFGFRFGSWLALDLDLDLV